MDKYDGSVGRNATLIIGLTPDTTGLIPAVDVKRLQDWVIEIKHQYGKPIAQTSGMKKVLSLSLDKVQDVNTCIIQENIAKGERIRQYQIEAKINGRWTVVCSGQSVGHKRIEHFPIVSTSALRLIVKESIAQPDIINFSVLCTTK
jgi:alpha-L-fucosidase